MDDCRGVELVTLTYGLCLFLKYIKMSVIDLCLKWGFGKEYVCCVKKVWWIVL